MTKRCPYCSSPYHLGFCDVERKRNYQESLRRFPSTNEILSWWLWYRQCKTVGDYQVALARFTVQGPIAVNLTLLENCAEYFETYRAS